MEALRDTFGKILEKIDLEKTIFVLSSDHGEYISVLDEDLNQIKTPKILKKTKKIIPSTISDPILSKLQRTRKSIELKKLEKNLEESMRVLLLNLISKSKISIRLLQQVLVAVLQKCQMV